jgi:putative intracellular protease/amidase
MSEADYMAFVRQRGKRKGPPAVPDRFRKFMEDENITIVSRHISEEEFAEDNVFHKKLTFNMPDALEAAGGNVVNTDRNFTSFAVVDRELVTAQNPMSDHELAAKFIELLAQAA